MLFRIVITAFLLAALLAIAVPARAAGPVVVFDNRSGDPALVRLVGPSPAVVGVPDGSTRSVNVRGGRYYILVRYGAPGSYSYKRGDSFVVTEMVTPEGYRYSRMTITLHKVVNGNYGSRPSTAAEFAHE